MYFMVNNKDKYIQPILYIGGAVLIAYLIKRWFFKDKTTGEGVDNTLENNNNEADRIDSNICNICLEELNYNQLYRTINCSHSFHPHCIDLWLFQSRFCPICRTHLTRHEST